jgi:signal transduction histidine kinase
MNSSNEFVETFYKHLFAFPETARYLHDPALVERLKQMQRKHLQSMLEGELNEAYADQRRKVGDVHAHVGLDPRLFLGAYNQYLQFGVRQLATSRSPATGDVADQISSLLKAVFLDIELTLDAYLAKETQNLRQALDMVFRANAELRQFAQLTSHDLKTPLATVANLCDEAIDEFGPQMPDEARRLVEMAKQRTYRMSEMIDELLELSAPPEQAESDCEVNTGQVIAEAIERLAREAEKRNIQIVLADGLPRVWGNRVRLREAFYNVLSNALKFIDKEAGKIEITAELTSETCTFAIADNGPGIPPEELDRIFSPFHRLNPQRGPESKPDGNTGGSGLGLYFVRSLIEQEGGRVWAESQLGAGSVFFIMLNCHE